MSIQIYGYIYCFSNISMPGILKIGMTMRTPVERLYEANLSNTWKPPTPYQIELTKRVYDCKKKEKVIHDLLNEYRIHTRREFFKVSIEKIDDIFNNLDKIGIYNFDKK